MEDPGDLSSSAAGLDAEQETPSPRAGAGEKVAKWAEVDPAGQRTISKYFAREGERGVDPLRVSGKMRGSAEFKAAGGDVDKSPEGEVRADKGPLGNRGGASVKSRFGEQRSDERSVLNETLKGMAVIVTHQKSPQSVDACASNEGRKRRTKMSSREQLSDEELNESSGPAAPKSKSKKKRTRRRYAPPEVAAGIEALGKSRLEMDTISPIPVTAFGSAFTKEMGELSMEERRAGVPRFLRKVHKWRPKIVCMVGKGIWEDVFAYVVKAGKGKGPVEGIHVQASSENGAALGESSFEFDIQPVCLLHGNEKGAERTLFFVVPSTSGRVLTHQLADKIELFKLLNKRWSELENGTLNKRIIQGQTYEIATDLLFRLNTPDPLHHHAPPNMNSPTKFTPKTTTPRPPLPSHAFNPLIASMDKTDPAPVKFQVITREGQDIIVGRVKIPTPNGNHAFILRRFDTGAISLSTMFRASFPSAGDEAEKIDSNWVKANYDLTGANGGGKLRLAGTWVPPALAVHLAPSYSLSQVVFPLAEAQPDATASYRKSSRHTTNGPDMEEDLAESKALIERLKQEKAAAEAKARELAEELNTEGVDEAVQAGTSAKRGREVTPPLTLSLDRQPPETSERQLVRNRTAQHANRRSAMWGAVAFAVGLGVTTVIPNLFF
ncbi:hypothetical protein FRC06_009989 [Ceratobasidium sp. 370]|nr:hypothetical protein FRC06_009989 [Ceratobasidium sp. 370]